jgi:hypothetical protein
MTAYARDEEYEEAIAQLTANRERAATLARPQPGVRRAQPIRPPLNTLSVSSRTRTPRCGFPTNVSDDFFSSQDAAVHKPMDEDTMQPPSSQQQRNRKRPIADVFPKSAEDHWRSA